ncbi:MAG: lysophospholipid acyltransferase family protein [Nannocystaceae bacterium]
MSVDRRKGWFLALARRYVRGRLRRGFDGVYVAGEAQVRAALRGPVILAANHVAWWDALTVLLLDQRLGGDGRCLMDADNLRRLPFFAWVGALPLDRSSPRRALADLDRGLRALDRPGRALWIFPQGAQRPAHLRPLGLQRGVVRLARRSGAPVVPVSLNYLYREAPEPTVVVAYGAPIDPGRGAALLGDLEVALERGLDQIDAFVTRGEGDFIAALPGRRRAIEGGGAAPLLGRALALAAGERRGDGGLSRG